MAHFEDCKFFLRGACVNGPQCGFRHNEASCHTERLCNRWAAGYTCDGRCNLRHPSAAEIAALATAPPAPTTSGRAAPLRRQQQAPASPLANLKQQQQQPTGVAAAPVKSTAPPCRFHAKGRCAKGDACPFFHAPNAAQGAPPTLAAGVTWAGRSSHQDPTTLRGAAAAARKQQRGARQGGVGTAGAGWAGGDGRPGTVPAASNGGGGGDGVPTEADAAAKARAADILQKHRLTSSAPAVEAGSRGGVHFRRGPSAEPGGKKACTSSPAQRQPPRTATDGQAPPATAAAAAPAQAPAPAPATAAPAAVAPAAAASAALEAAEAAVVATEVAEPAAPSTPNEPKLPAESGEKGGGGDMDGQENGGSGGAGADASSGAKVDAVAETEEAPSCDGAVVHAHSQQQPQQQHTRATRPAAIVS